MGDGNKEIKTHVSKVVLLRDFELVARDLYGAKIVTEQKAETPAVEPMQLDKEEIKKVIGRLRKQKDQRGLHKLVEEKEAL